VKSTSLAATGFAAPIYASSPANAIDCAAASKHVEKMICGDAKLKAADAALNSAYATLLRSAADREIRDLIIASQRRWLKARDGEFAGAQDKGVDGATGGEPPDEAAVLLSAIERRTNSMTGTQYFPDLAGVIKKMRANAATYTDGPYAGYQTDCWFAPQGFGDGDYLCLGTQTFQNKSRICRSSTSWASGHTTEYRTVADVVGNGVKMKAACATGYESTDTPCPEPGLDEGHWNMKPVATQDTPEFTLNDREHLQKYDPDADRMTQGDEPWLRECLTDPNYPAPGKKK
jgi:uncharacterized protein YecT (DUF1311 family)